MKNNVASLLKSLTILLFIFFSTQTLARNNILDHIEVQNSNEQSVIKITFIERLVYRSHTPINNGDLVTIQLNTQTPITASERLVWTPTATIPLFEAVLDPLNDQQAELVLRFNREVDFDIQASSDSYSITITLHHAATEKVVTLPEIVVTATVPPVPEFQKNAENELLAKLMEEARQAMSKEEYSTAIQLYTKVLGKDQTVFAKQALEYLGVAREKKKQLAHAKNIYEQYLKRYPKGEDTDRVRQRLLAMISASDIPKEKLRDVAQTKTKKTKWQIFGGISQNYNNNVTVSDTSGRNITQDELRSDLDVSAQLRAHDYDIKARFTGGYTNKFQGSNDEQRLSSFYVDTKDKIRGASVRLGRQSRTTGGVLGRFDGIFGDYQVKEKIKVNVVAGYPVDSSRDVKIVSERYFYGISADIGTINKAWDFNIFAINQENDGFTDRQAIGGEARYFDTQKSFFTLVDYDVHFDELNLFIFNSRWTLSDKTTANINYDYRNSPILTTRNALTGQTVTHLQELLNIFPRSTIFDLAKDRTAQSQSLFAGISHQLNKQFQLNGDIRLSKLTDTKTSGGVIASAGTDLEKEYSLQLTGTSLFKEGDLLLLTTSYSDLTTSDSTTVTLNTRYPLTSKLRINPRMRYRYRDNHINSSTQETYSPSLQLTYRVYRNFQLEAETAADWEKTTLADGTEEWIKNYFFLLGYRYDF
jgi:tetratricopeptide (TPR) repeat protein